MGILCIPGSCLSTTTAAGHAEYKGTVAKDLCLECFQIETHLVFVLSDS